MQPNASVNCWQICRKKFKSRPRKPTSGLRRILTIRVYTSNEYIQEGRFMQFVFQEIIVPLVYRKMVK